MNSILIAENARYSTKPLPNNISKTRLPRTISSFDVTRHWLPFLCLCSYDEISAHYLSSPQTPTTLSSFVCLTSIDIRRLIAADVFTIPNLKICHCYLLVLSNVPVILYKKQDKALSLHKQAPSEDAFLYFKANKDIWQDKQRRRQLFVNYRGSFQMRVFVV